MNDSLKMPERADGDGAMAVNRVDEFIVLKATQNGKEESMLVSEYNAWRLFGAMAVVLGIPLPPRIGKLIRF